MQYTFQITVRGGGNQLILICRAGAFAKIEFSNFGKGIREPGVPTWGMFPQNMQFGDFEGLWDF
jgi:hypothetical protein